MTRVVLVPGTLALLPEYTSIEDPVADLRAACLEAVAWLLEPGPVTIVGDPQGRRVGEWLVKEARGAGVSRLRRQGAFAPQPPEGGAPQPPEGGSAVLVVGNGSACRTEKAPGYLDERSSGFDADLARALTAPDPETLAGLDQTTSDELLAATESIRALGEVLTPQHVATVDYDDDPFGVQYWVVRWASD